MRHHNTVKLLELAKALAGSSEGLTLDEMAQTLKVSRRTAERMRNAVRAIWPHMDEVSDGPRIRFRIPGGLDSFVQAPTAEELAELDAAVKALDASGGTARAAILRSLGGKIRSAQRRTQLARIEPDLDALTIAQVPATQAGPRPLADPTTLSLVKNAILAGCRLRLNYRRGDGKERARVLEPFGLIYGRSYYLVAREAGHVDPVLWRFDRMSDLALDAPADPIPADFDLSRYAAQSFGTYQEAPRAIHLRFDANVAESVRRFHFHPSQKMEILDDGCTDVRFTTGGLLEIARHLVTWGGSVVVVGPDELKAVLLNELAAIQARYHQPAQRACSEEHLVLEEEPAV